MLVRATVISVASIFGLVAIVAVAGVVALNHLASNIKRVPVSFAKLAADQRVAGASSQSMNVLLTDTSATGGSGFVMVLHINADKQAGGVVSLPPDAVVSVPGHGRTKLQNAQALGGPSLLVSTAEDVTENPIEHYANIDFAHVQNVISTIGGVDVTLPAASSGLGYTFHAGVNHLTARSAIAYLGDPSLSELGQVERQGALIRAILKKIANDNLLNVTGTYSTLNALTSMLTVDSNFTNGDLTSLANELKNLGSNDGTFLTAPTHTNARGERVMSAKVCEKMWTAIAHDSLAAFAAKYPSTVTPAAVP